jgi:hypothetical protein
MSTDYDLYVKTKLKPAEVAKRVQRDLGGTMAPAKDPGQWCVWFHQIGYPGAMNVFIGSWGLTYEPGEHDLIEHCNMQLCIDYAPSDVQRELALAFARQFARRIQWPFVLVKDFVWVTAVNDPERGYREFPADKVNLDTPREALWSHPEGTDPLSNLT